MNFEEAPRATARDAKRCCRRGADFKDAPGTSAPTHCGNSEAIFQGARRRKDRAWSLLWIRYVQPTCPPWAFSDFVTTNIAGNRPFVTRSLLRGGCPVVWSQPNASNSAVLAWIQTCDRSGVLPNSVESIFILHVRASIARFGGHCGCFQSIPCQFQGIPINVCPRLVL